MKNILSIVKEDVKGNSPGTESPAINDKNKLENLLVSVDSTEEMETYITLFEEFIQTT